MVCLGLFGGVWLATYPAPRSHVGLSDMQLSHHNRDDMISSDILPPRRVAEIEEQRC